MAVEGLLTTDAYDRLAFAAAADRRRAESRIAIPTRFITTIIIVILRAKVDTLSTLMIGNTDSTMYNSVISRPDSDARRSHSGGMRGYAALAMSARSLDAAGRASVPPIV